MLCSADILCPENKHRLRTRSGTASRNRRLGNGHAYCLVNGQRAPYVGNICMDVCMIDVTGIDCKEGDRVELFGDHLPVTVLSDVLQTIPYEVLTSVSTRVKRVYYI